MKGYELAKELGVESKTLVKRANENLGLNMTHMTSLSEEDELVIRALFKERSEAKKQTSKPWDADNNPWTLNMLSLQKERPGFRPRFTTADKLQRKLDQGWQLAKREDYGGLGDRIAGEEGKNGTMIKRRELILIEMPEELAQKRDEFYKRKTDQRSMSAAQIAKDQAEKTEKAVGPGLDFQQESTIR